MHMMNFSKITQHTQEDCASVLETDLWSVCPSFFTANVLVLRVLFSFADCSVLWKALVCESKRRYLATWKMCFCSLKANWGTLWFMSSVSRLPRTAHLQWTLAQPRGPQGLWSLGQIQSTDTLTMGHHRSVSLLLTTHTHVTLTYKDHHLSTLWSKIQCRIHFRTWWWICLVHFSLYGRPWDQKPLDEYAGVFFVR